jgi:hypothetical protein
LDELIELGPCLGVQLNPDESLSEAEAERVFNMSHDQSSPLHRELQAWLTLHQTVELSLKHGTAIYFSSS